MIEFFPDPDHLFFSADYHHDNFEVNRYCVRPFFHDEKGNFDDHHRHVMDRSRKTIVKKHNSRVQPNDMFIYIGDLTFRGTENFNSVRQMANELNGRKIFIYGNHDRFMPFAYVDMGFMMAASSLVIEKYGITVVHDPVAANVDPERKWLWICGHVHLAWLFQKYNMDTGLGHNCINAGVDVWDFYPVSLREIFNLADREGLR